MKFSNQLNTADIKRSVQIILIDFKSSNLLKETQFNIGLGTTQLKTEYNKINPLLPIQQCC